MNYLIVTNSHEPFYTNWFSPENNWIDGCEMIVFNLLTHKWTSNGKDWHDITQDHL